MIILLFGPPGSGKGTQSSLLVSEKNMKHISTGDLFRAAIKNQSPLGVKAKSYMDAGNLVPDDVTIGLFEEVFAANQGSDLILDGFPRTIPQAEALEKLLQEKQLKLDKAVFIKVPQQELMTRLTGRRSCGNCGAIYHVLFKPMAKPGVCDVCGSTKIVHREDDKAEAIQVRLEAYEKSTLPLVEFYKKSGRYKEVDGTGETDEVFKRLLGAIY